MGKLTDDLRAHYREEKRRVESSAGKTIHSAMYSDPVVILTFTDGTKLIIEGSEWLSIHTDMKDIITDTSMSRGAGG